MGDAPRAVSPLKKGVAALIAIAGSKAALTIADQGIVSVANFATSIILGRMCSKEEFGLYLLGFSIVILAVNTQSSLISAAYTVFSPRMKGEEHARYTGSTLIHQITYALIIVAALAIAAGAMGFGGGPQGLSPVLWTLAAVIAMILLKEYARQVCFAGLRTKTVFALDTAVSALQVAGLLLLARFGGLSAQHAYAVIGCCAGAAGLLWLAASRRLFSPRLSAAPAHFRKNWGYGKWIFAYNVAFIASNQIYPWLLLAFHGAEANGIYGACAGVIFLVNPLIIGLGNFLGPKTVHALNQSGPEAMRRVVRIADLFFLAVIGGFAVTMFFAGEWVLTLFYGQKYAGNGAVVIVLGVVQVAWALTVPANFGLNALERPDVAFKSLLLSLVVMVTAGVWLVWAYGPLGVAFGLFAGNVAACAFTRLYFGRQIGIRLAQHGTLET